MSWDPSPGQRRLLFAGVVVLLTGVGIYLTAPELFGLDRSTRDSAESASPVAEPSAPAGDESSAVATPAETPTSVRPTPSLSEAQKPYVRKALRFAQAFTKTDRPADKWHAAVARHTTSELADSLAYTDPRMVPDGTPLGQPRVLTTGETTVEVAVPLDNGTSILLTVSSVGDGYAVANVRSGEDS